MSGGGGELQTPYRLAVRVRTPAQHGGGRIAVQGLLGRPERLQLRLPGGAARFDQQQSFERNAGGGQCPGVEGVRWCNQNQPAILGAELFEGRQQQRKFALAGAIAEQFGQCAARPASARQFAIQRRKSACHRR